MPYSRQTPRRPLRHFVTLDRLTEANWQVTVEMERLGLWCGELDDIDVWLVPVSFRCYGWFQPEGDIYIPAVPVKAESFEQIPGYPLDAPPVFFGHYLKPGASPLSPERHNAACLDHAAAKDGPLVAYRWKGEAVINPQHYVPSHES